MKKQTKSNWQNTAFAFIASVAFVFAFCCQAAAQSEIQFNALYNCPDSNMYYFKVLDCADGKDCKVLFVNTSTPSASYEWKVEKSKILSAFKTGGCTIEGKKLEAVKNNPPKENTQKPNETEENPDAEENLTEEKPQTEGCSFDEPAGTASKTAKPTAALFKRVIFEQYQGDANGRKLGINYQTFALGKSYVNRLTGKGLLHDGAPQNAMIYTVKTKFIRCEKFDDSTRRTTYDAQYSCFKDSFGEWVCPSDATKISDAILLPNK